MRRSFLFSESACLILCTLTTVSCLHTVKALQADFLTGADGWDVGGTDGEKIDLMQAPLMLLGSDDGDWRWWFDAPKGFRGDLSALHGGSLTYRIGMLESEGSFMGGEEWDVQLTSAEHSITLGFRGAVTPRAFVNEIKIALVADGGWVLEGTNGAPSQQTFQRLLSSVSAVRIRGGYYTGKERTFLSAVRMLPGGAGPSRPKEESWARAVDIASLPGVTDSVVGTTGSLGITQHQLIYVHRESGKIATVLLQDIEGVEEGSEGELVIAAKGGRELLRAGKLTSYEVLDIARLFELAKRRSDESRASSSASSSASSAPPPPPSPPNPHPTPPQRPSSSSSSSASTEPGSSSASSSSSPPSSASASSSSASRSSQSTPRPPPPPPPTAARSETAADGPSTAAGASAKKKRGQRSGEGEQRFLVGAARKRVLAAEKSLDVHSRSVLRRVEGSGGLLLLTAQEIIHVPPTVSEDEEDEEDGVPSGVLRVLLDRVVGVEREGSDVEVYSYDSHTPIRLPLNSFPFQDLMDLLDDASKLLGLT